MPYGDCSSVIDTLLSELEKDPVRFLFLSHRVVARGRAAPRGAQHGLCSVRGVVAAGDRVSAIAGARDALRGRSVHVGSRVHRGDQSGRNHPRQRGYRARQGALPQGGAEVLRTRRGAMPQEPPDRGSVRVLSRPGRTPRNAVLHRNHRRTVPARRLLQPVRVRQLAQPCVPGVSGRVPRGRWAFCGESEEQTRGR